MDRQVYPSDLTDAQWDVLKPMVISSGEPTSEDQLHGSARTPGMGAEGGRDIGDPAAAEQVQCEVATRRHNLRRGPRPHLRAVLVPGDDAHPMDLVLKF
jgi:hypothetical protein